MRINRQYHEIIYIPDPKKMLTVLELAGRTCYKSEDKITEDSAAAFVKKIIKSGHHSVIEHMNITIKFITDRSVTHELVRHRLAAYSQESQRYVKYDGIEFILPVWMHPMLAHEWGYGDLDAYPQLPEDEKVWLTSMLSAEWSYWKLIKEGWKPQQARSVLPNSTKTEIVMTANLREWRHVLKLRTAKAAHPQIRELMLGLLVDLTEEIPVVFDDI